MTVDLSNPSSVRAWLAVAPDRHKAMLRGMWRIWPQWREVFEEAAR